MTFHEFSLTFQSFVLTGFLEKLQKVAGQIYSSFKSQASYIKINLRSTWTLLFNHSDTNIPIRLERKKKSFFFFFKYTFFLSISFCHFISSVIWICEYRSNINLISTQILMASDCFCLISLMTRCQLVSLPLIWLIGNYMRWHLVKSEAYKCANIEFQSHAQWWHRFFWSSNGIIPHVILISISNH